MVPMGLTHPLWPKLFMLDCSSICDPRDERMFAGLSRREIIVWVARVLSVAVLTVLGTYCILKNLVAPPDHRDPRTKQAGLEQAIGEKW